MTESLRTYISLPLLGSLGIKLILTSLAASTRKIIDLDRNSKSWSSLAEPVRKRIHAMNPSGSPSEELQESGRYETCSQKHLSSQNYVSRGGPSESQDFPDPRCRGYKTMTCYTRSEPHLSCTLPLLGPRQPGNCKTTRRSVEATPSIVSFRG